MKTLSNKEKRELIEKGFEITKKSIIILKDNIYYLDNDPVWLKVKDLIIPFLKNVDYNLTLFSKRFNSIYIDQGAMPFILKGADLMKPGIVKNDNFEKSEVVLIREENYNKVIAIGLSLVSSEEMSEIDKGKVVKIIHYYNDEYFTK